VDADSTFIWWFATGNLKFDIFPSTNISVGRIMLKIGWSGFASQSKFDNFSNALLIFKATENI
jgi:hypothetical protein